METSDQYTEKGKILCIDLGAKKTGLAISDITQNFARALYTVPTAILADKLIELIVAERTVMLVIGLPCGRDGQPNDATQNVKAQSEDLALKIKGKIKEKIGYMPEIAYQNERLSSWEARELLRDEGYSPDEIKAKEDHYAAMIILQDFLRQLPH